MPLRTGRARARLGRSPSSSDTEPPSDHRDEWADSARDTVTGESLGDAVAGVYRGEGAPECMGDTIATNTPTPPLDPAARPALAERGAAVVRATPCPAHPTLDVPWPPSASGSSAGMENASVPASALASTPASAGSAGAGLLPLEDRCGDSTCAEGASAWALDKPGAPPKVGIRSGSQSSTTSSTASLTTSTAADAMLVRRAAVHSSDVPAVGPVRLGDRSV